MDEPIEESYFNWLCAKVVEPPSQGYIQLLRILYSTEFVWLLIGDRNRVDDGLELRQEFVRETGLNDEVWYSMPCSVFEMFLAFSRRAEFQTDTLYSKWFWEFISNLHLEDYKRVSDSDEARIESILHAFIWRTYESDGQGGMFPLRTPNRDQRKVEIWYQFCDYLDDHGLLYELL